MENIISPKSCCIRVHILISRWNYFKQEKALRLMHGDARKVTSDESHWKCLWFFYQSLGHWETMTIMHALTEEEKSPVDRSCFWSIRVVYSVLVIMFSLSRCSFKASVDVSVFNNACISKIDYIWWTKGLSTVFHDKIIVGLCLHSLVLSVKPMIEAFNMDCSLPKGNVCHNFILIILKIPSVLKTLE